VFTGIIEEVGTVERLVRGAGSAEVSVEAPGLARDLVLGESVAVSGVCLTVTGTSGHRMRADISGETLDRSTLGRLVPGDSVNLERALRLGDRLGGHIVQGHVDGRAVVRELRRSEAGAILAVEIPASLQQYVVEKGSVAVDGVSLTVASLQGQLASIAVAPHTLSVTTLNRLQPGHETNLEVDILGKYVERLLAARGREDGEGGLTPEFLAEHGFA
jgi:riboflavin synthase